MSKNSIPPFEIMPPAEFDVNNPELHVRLFKHGDEDQLLKLVQDEPVQRFVPWAKFITDDESANKMISSFESAWEHKTMARYAVEKDGDIIGYTGLWSDRNPGYFEFGFAVLPEYRGQGIGTATIKEILEIARTRLDAKGMVAYVDDTNDASKSVVNSFNFSPTDEFDDGDRRYVLEF